MIYTSPDKTASVPFQPNGIYTGLVTRVDTANQRVWVMIPRVANGFQFGPLTVLSTDLPAVNDRVGCMFVENRADDVVVLGSIKSSTSPVYATPITCTSTTRPVDAAIGTIIYETDTSKTVIWNGSSWGGLNIDTLLVDSDTLYIDAANNRVGINTSTPTVALDVDGSMAASSVYSSTSITAASAITGGSISTLGQVSGGSIYASGQVSGASVIASGPVSATSITATTTATSERFISTQTTGTAPLTIASETLVTNLNADRLDGEHGSWYSPSGLISPYAGLTAPPGWLFCNGQSVSRTTYATLFSTLTATVGTCTITTASPAVVSLTAHDLVEGDAIYFTTTGALPTGLSANTTYYVKSTGNANTFQVSLTRTSSATAFTAGTAVNTTVAGSGTHTVVKAPYGVPSSLNFYVPDFRGRTPVGIDNIGGTDAGLLSLTNALGGAGGVQTVTLDGTQIPSHIHGATGLTIGTTGSTHTHAAGSYDGTLGINNNLVTDGGGGNAYQALTPSGSPNSRIVTNTTGSTHTHDITGSTAGLTGAGQLHDNMQPFMLVNYIIKT